MSDRMGQVIGNRYRLSSIVGRGGHSIVYRAEDLLQQRVVAIKILHESFASRPEYGVRMAREFRALTMLGSTSAAVQVEELRATPEGALCLVMELLEGMDLDDFLASEEKEGHRLAVRTLFSFLDPIVETLGFAHEHGIVHRDVKPGNIFVMNQVGRDPVRLLDFGLCKLPGSQPLTRDGMILGSPSYIAPEVWAGKPALLDARCDIYSLGAVAFRMLAGRVPFEGGSLRQKLELVTRGPRPALTPLRPDLPDEVDQWVAQALAVDPNTRFGNVHAMWSALRHVLLNQP